MRIDIFFFWTFFDVALREQLSKIVNWGLLVIEKPLKVLYFMYTSMEILKKWNKRGML
jgi:hypothetical protein